MSQKNVETKALDKPDDKPADKPGYKTTEFWLTTVATLAGIVLASGLIVEGSTAAQIVGGVLAVLSQLGYTASRTQVKKPSGK
jgi:hypothetical protein